MVSLYVLKRYFLLTCCRPMGNHTINIENDRPFLESKIPYMAALSPLFFTHYGTEGEFGWNKYVNP